MFQREKDVMFKGLPNIFCIEDDIIIVGHNTDSIDHDNMVRNMLKCPGKTA